MITKILVASALIAVIGMTLQGAAQADLMLLQDRNVILGRGTLASGGSTLTATASGQISVDVLYLDLVSLEDLKLYRLTLTMGQDSLSGSYNAFDGLGRTWSGSV
jgi:hypothetical protein